MPRQSQRKILEKQPALMTPNRNWRDGIKDRYCMFVYVRDRMTGWESKRNNIICAHMNITARLKMSQSSPISTDMNFFISCPTYINHTCPVINPIQAVILLQFKFPHWIYQCTKNFLRTSSSLPLFLHLGRGITTRPWETRFMTQKLIKVDFAEAIVFCP